MLVVPLGRTGHILHRKIEFQQLCVCRVVGVIFQPRLQRGLYCTQRFPEDVRQFLQKDGAILGKNRFRKGHTRFGRVQQAGLFGDRLFLHRHRLVPRCQFRNRLPHFQKGFVRLCQSGFQAPLSPT